MNKMSFLHLDLKFTQHLECFLLKVRIRHFQKQIFPQKSLDTFARIDILKMLWENLLQPVEILTQNVEMDVC